MAAIVFIFFGVFALILVLNIGKGVAEWSDNNNQPVLSEEVRLVTKRFETGHSIHRSRRNRSFQTREGHRPTSYYATFEFASGIRREFSIDGEEYGMLAEGDDGILTYQGTRYKGFERHRVRAIVRIQD